MNLSCVESSISVQFPMIPGLSRGETVALLITMRSVRTIAARLLLTACFALAATTAFAVTVDQIVALSKAGVSDAVILALLDRDGSVLTIQPEQLIALKRAGLSDALLTAMLKNGRAEGEDAARAASAASAAGILATLSASPEVKIIGHGPDRPNTAHTEDLYAGLRDGVRLPAAIPYASPYAIPYASPFIGSRFKHAYNAHPPLDSSYRDRLLCLAQVNTARGAGPSYVTECPAVMQRQLRTR
jgi:hypothetical protein